MERFVEQLSPSAAQAAPNGRCFEAGDCQLRKLPFEPANAIKFSLALFWH
jgi:hypothetical protein